MIIDFQGKSPKIGNNVFIAPDAWIIGDVTIEDNVSIFFGAILRGDIKPIFIGKNTNIQEHCVIHSSPFSFDVQVGQNVTIGHRAIIHSAIVRDYSLIGMGSTILDNAVIELETVVGANSLVTENKVMPAGYLILGSPATPVRPLSDEEKGFLRLSADHYLEKGRQYRALHLSK
ncbi:MAG: gamma carbonic anhydrase family protein [Deltaproteobacteria bacterium]|nr:gamma carbonic anhydrase family protein [Deltaproteobacteria bacterium]